MNYTAETMLYKQTLFLIATCLTAVVCGLPSFDTVDLNRRCGSNAVTCHGSHRAPSSVCLGLAVALGGPQESGTVTRNPRSICFTETGQSVNGKCCVSWANNVSNAVDGDFLNAITALNNQCVDTSSGQVSGLMRDTTIGSTCTTVCLSNRDDGCR
jgi:hypothetical protein